MNGAIGVQEIHIKDDSHNASTLPPNSSQVPWSMTKHKPAQLNFILGLSKMKCRHESSSADSMIKLDVTLVKKTNFQSCNSSSEGRKLLVKHPSSELPLLRWKRICNIHYWSLSQHYYACNIDPRRCMIVQMISKAIGHLFLWNKKGGIQWLNPPRENISQINFFDNPFPLTKYSFYWNLNKMWHIKKIVWQSIIRANFSVT